MHLSLGKSVSELFALFDLFSTAERVKIDDDGVRNIFSQCRQHLYSEREFSGIDGVKNIFYQVSMTRINACTEIFGGAEIWRGMIVYEKNKWKMWSELKWIFHISMFFEKKFELEFTRHSRLLIVQ